MKTIIANRFFKTAVLTAALFTVFAASAFAKPTDVSKYLIKQFQKQFQHANNVTWKTTDRFTSASFMLDGTKTSVFYNNENNFIGISKDITLADLPTAARRQISSFYNTNAITSIIDFTDENGIETDYIQLHTNGKDIILQCDEQGRVSDYKK